MLNTIRPRDILSRTCKRTGRICGHGDCRRMAVVTLTYVYTPYFGQTYSIEKHRCEEHAAPAMAAKAAS